ncbi:hypothetical protein SCUCBS95973_003768 [Sporothrix curviconia]|uniref:Biogenesis of lysosome-related organelles complex 1 subunit 1 n=1 Tax=Sporothrix curviconia TaxID=1260050 RepID=A0ABP0BIH8_9PEZI
MADPDSASASASNPTPSTAPGGATPSSASHLPPILSRLASDRAATASISTVNAVGVAGGSSAPATSATASLSKRDESMLRVVRRADSASSAAVTSASTTTSPTTTTAEASVASPHVAPASSVSSVSLPVRDGPPNPNVLGAAPPPPPPMPDEENNVPTAGGLTSQGLFNLPTDIGPAGPSSVATAPAAMMTTSSSSPQRQTQQPTLASRFLPTIPSASAQRAIVEARQAIDATIANLLDSQLQDRALLMHGNMRSIAGQQRDLGSAVVGLRKANDDLAHLVQETLVPLKEVGNVQNWTEMQHRSLSVVEETIRLLLFREKSQWKSKSQPESQSQSQLQQKRIWQPRPIEKRC